MSKTSKYFLSSTVLSVVAALLIPSICFCAKDQSDPADVKSQELTTLSLEDLTNVEVASASRHLQKLGDIPAAVYVITYEDIRRSGLNSIPEILRLAPGVEVQRINSNQWAITCRGFNNSFANKLLVMIDGRSVYSTLYAGVFWDVQDLMIDDIDRIEVIRGPGATMWGANAVNGVINIITKKAEDTEGKLLTLSHGDQRTNLTQFRYGGPIGNGSFRVYAKQSDMNSFKKADGTNALDEWGQTRGGFRADFGNSENNSVTVQGDIYRGFSRQQIAQPSFVPPFTATVDDRGKVSGGNALVKWFKSTSDNSNLELQAYFDRTTRSEYQYVIGNNTYDLNLQRRTGLGNRHELTWGLGYRYSDSSTNGLSGVSWTPNKHRDSLYSAFAQDEIRLSVNKCRMVIGSKFEQNDYTGYEIQPNARLIWNAEGKQSVWASVSRAVRIPDQTEVGGQVNVAVIPGFPLSTLIQLNGTANLKPEELVAYELGYRVQPAKNTSVDASAYYNVYHNLHTYNMQPTVSAGGYNIRPLVSANSLEGTTYGAEVAANWVVNDRWRVSAGLNAMVVNLNYIPPAVDMSTKLTAENNSPRTRLNLSSYLNLPGGFQFDTLLFYYSAYGQGKAPSWARVDLRLGWKRPNGLELSVGVQDLFGHSHREYGYSSLGSEANVGRNMYVTAGWTF